jgi:hypothetical protein
MDETSPGLSEYRQYIESLEILMAIRVDELEARVARLETPRKHIGLYWVVRADDIAKVEGGPYTRYFDAHSHAYGNDHLITVETRHDIFDAWE